MIKNNDYILLKLEKNNDDDKMCGLPRLGVPSAFLWSCAEYSQPIPEI